MFSRHILLSGTRFIQIGIPSTIKRKCLSSELSNYRLFFQEHKTSLIVCNYFSSDEGPSKPYSPKYQKGEYNSEEKIKLRKWIDMVKFEGERVPKNISENEFLDILLIESEQKRIQYLNHLFVKEISKIKERTRKEKLRELKRQKQDDRESMLKGHIVYGLWKNSMFAQITKHHRKALLNYKLVNAIKFNQPLVIDLDFSNNMDKIQGRSLGEQVAFSVQRNRVSSKPFNLTLCNVNDNSQEFRKLSQVMPNVVKPAFPMNITSKTYLDIFPKEKLIYITPHARDVMKEFDHEAIYIIGGLVDNRGPGYETTAKAKRENIRTMKFPIDRYHVPRKKGNTKLAVHVMVNILLELQKNGDWVKAFKFIPKRLLQTGDESHVDNYEYAKIPKF